MSEFKSDILNDQVIRDIVKKIFESHSNDILRENIDELNKYVLIKYCYKQYLNQCEPLYCSFRITGECKYSEALFIIKSELKIDLIEGRTVNE